MTKLGHSWLDLLSVRQRRNQDIPVPVYSNKDQGLWWRSNYMQICQAGCLKGDVRHIGTHLALTVGALNHGKRVRGDFCFFRVDKIQVQDQQY